MSEPPQQVCNLSNIHKRLNVEPKSFTQQQGLYVLGTINYNLMSVYVLKAVICLFQPLLRGIIVTASPP